MALEPGGSRRWTIAELARTLPTGHLMNEGSADPAVAMVPSPPAGFVAPDLIIPESHSDQRILLFEAAGAVGKSCTAEALASTLGWPLVTAERAQVGSYSLSGLLYTAFGLTSTFIHDMANGRVGLVVDSLDEAHLKAGTQNFLAFLEDVAKLAMAGDSSGVRLILMSRPDTADLVEVAMADFGTTVTRAEIGMFSREQANLFIDEYMGLRYSERRVPGYNVRFSHPNPFRALRDSRFQQLESLLLAGADPMSADILGYVPVLIAIAESLAVSNPAANMPKGESSHASQVSLLADIVRGILSRDAAKFQTTMARKLKAVQAAEDGADLVVADLYSPAEQVLRLYASCIGQRLAAQLPASLPPSLRADYENGVANFLADHPFTRGSGFVSLVFSDFVAADAVCSPVSAAILGSLPRPDPDTLGPFFVWLLRELRGTEVAIIDEAHLEAAIASWSMDAALHSAEYSPQALLVQSGTSTHLLLGDRAGSRPDLVFHVDGASGVVVLARPYPNLTIITDGGVALGDGAHLTLSANFEVAAAEIELNATSLSVGRGHRASLIADTLSAGALQSISASEQDLVVVAAKIPPKLYDFAKTLGPTASTVRYAEYVALRSILMSFRSTVHNGLCAPREQMERYIVKGSTERQQILDALISEGVVAIEGSWYTLNSSALDRVGLSLVALKSGVPNDAISAFLAGARGRLPVE